MAITHLRMCRIETSQTSTVVKPPRRRHRWTDTRPVEDTWTNRDLPVLKAIVEIADETADSSIDISDIKVRVGMDDTTLQRALRALYGEPYLQEPKPTIARRKHPNRATRFHELHPARTATLIPLDIPGHALWYKNFRNFIEEGRYA